jgi:VWFA-related protein
MLRRFTFLFLTSTFWFPILFAVSLAQPKSRVSLAQPPGRQYTISKPRERKTRERIKMVPIVVEPTTTLLTVVLNPVINGLITIKDEFGTVVTQEEAGEDGQAEVPLRKGRTYQIQVTAPNYRTASVTMKGPLKSNYAVQRLQLTPEFVGIEFLTLPANSQIYIDDKLKKITQEHGPDRIDDLEPGTYTLLIRHPDYNDHTYRLESLKAGTTVTFPPLLLTRLARLTIEGPAGASILIDGTFKARIEPDGNVRIDYPLEEAGEHTITAELTGYKIWSSCIMLTPGPRTITVEMEQETTSTGVKVRTELVNVDVLVRHRETGGIISTLNKDDFTVIEDGVKQTISHFSQERLPLSIVLLVDRAGCINAFNDQIRAATVEAFGQLKPEDEVAIMTFSNKVSLAQPFTRDSQLIADKIMSVELQHSSEQHYFNAGIYEAATYMGKAANPIGRRAIIVLTSLEASIDFSKISEKEALEALLESGAVVSGILVKTVGGRIQQGVRGKPTSVLRHIGLRSGSLKMFVEETGGELIGAAPEKTNETLMRMVNHLSVSYSLAYLPTNSARDGKRRRIQVQLSPDVEKREGKTVLITRRSYIMPKDIN